MQLAAAYEHGAYLSQLARLTAQAVCLGVEHEKLRASDRLVQQVHAPVIRLVSDAMNDLLQSRERALAAPRSPRDRTALNA